MNNIFLGKPSENIIYEIKTRGKLVIHLTNGKYVTFTKEEVGDNLKIKDQLWGGKLLEPYLSKIKYAFGGQNVTPSHITKIIDRGGFITNIVNGCCQCSELVQCCLPCLSDLSQNDFYGTKIEYIDFPKIRALWTHNVFCECTQLKTVKMNNCQTIGWTYLMFQNCQQLEHIEFNSLSDIQGNEEHMFMNCPNLKDLTFPKLKVINTQTRPFFINVGIERVNFPKLEQLVNPMFFMNMEQCKYVNLGKLTMTYVKQNNEWGLPSGCEIRCIDGTYIKE